MFASRVRYLRHLPLNTVRARPPSTASRGPEGMDRRSAGRNKQRSPTPARRLLFKQHSRSLFKQNSQFLTEEIQFGERRCSPDPAFSRRSPPHPSRISEAPTAPAPPARESRGGSPPQQPRPRPQEGRDGVALSQSFPPAPAPPNP